MSLSTTHDFYLGRGRDAEWLGSAYLGANHCRTDVGRFARTEREFAQIVDEFLQGAAAREIGEVTRPGQPWPWPWPTSHGTDYVHAFDNGTLWTAVHGQRWSMCSPYLPPLPDDPLVEFPHGRAQCTYTGIDAADTTSRRYRPLLSDTHRHDLQQLGLRILADLTLPLPPGAPTELAELRAQLSPHLRYAVTAYESTVELEFEVFGHRNDVPAANSTAHALTMLPVLYGWTDLEGGPPRFGVRVVIADNDRHTSHPVLSDYRARAVLTTY